MENACFAMQTQEKCSALVTRGTIDCSVCPFHKTSARLAEDRLRIDKRLASLDCDMQAAISEKYFNGRAPWREAVGG
jgi:hypothetical protein